LLVLLLLILLLLQDDRCCCGDQGPKELQQLQRPPRIHPCNPTLCALLLRCPLATNITPR
jgi:hypothetical protein